MEYVYISRSNTKKITNELKQKKKQDAGLGEVVRG